MSSWGPSTSVALHENVRLQVSLLIFNILKEAVRERLRLNPSCELTLLESFLERKNSRHPVILMPQEVYIGNERCRVDAIFGGFIAFDYKSREGEFEDALRTACYKYLPYLPKVKYFVVTNYHKWKVCKVSRSPDVQLTDIYEGDVEGVIGFLKQIILSEIEALKVPSYPELIEKLYTIDEEELVENLKTVFDEVRSDDRVKPLFNAYRRIMELLYGKQEKNEEFYSDLFVRHTIMHMMVMASLAAALNLLGDPIDVCSGTLLTADERSLDVALPYLNWWRMIDFKTQKDLRNKIRKITENIAARARLVDWELGKGEDVFRSLYEILVEPETRRKIGEYYTPLWIIDMILKEFELKDKLIMDPFCGTGAFLVRAFYKKVLEEKEDADKAYSELIGLDVNPLAVAIARAELVIAYRRVTGKMPSEPPRIFHTDTLAILFGCRELLMEDPEYMGIVETISDYAGIMSIEDSDVLSKMKPQDLLSSLSRVERLLATSIKLAVLNNEKNFEDAIKERLLDKLDDKDPVEKLFRRILTNTEFASKLAKLIEKYGDGVWAVAIISAVVPTIAKVLKPHIVVTNPPWVQMTEYQTKYSESMRRIAINVLKESLKVDARRAASIVSGSDVACMALYKALEIAREGIGFVMNREQSFYSRSSVGSGMLLTYSILKKLCNEGCDVKLIDIDYDAFGHGIYPALVIVKKRFGAGEYAS